MHRHLHLAMKFLFRMFAKNPLLDAISTNDLPTLRSLLEDQDRQLFSRVAQNGTPEIAAYLLSRHPVFEDYTQEFLPSNLNLHPTQYLACQSARYANADLFRYLLDQYPTLLTTYNRNVDYILVNAMEGGVSMWKIILEHDSRWMDHEFRAHQGCVLEFLLTDNRNELLEFLLKKMGRYGQGGGSGAGDGQATPCRQ